MAALAAPVAVAPVVREVEAPVGLVARAALAPDPEDLEVLAPALDRDRVRALRFLLHQELLSRTELPSLLRFSGS